MSECLADDYLAVIETPLPSGTRLGIRGTPDTVTEIDFLPVSTPVREPISAVAARVVQQLRGYFTDPHQVFALPLGPKGTEFQRRVWQALCAIPPGRPVSYGTLARALGSSSRAVAGACRANPLPILIPCHRVVAANGPGGYMGATAGEAMRLKHWLLGHESAV